jgi:hypothetical protein
MQRRSRLTAMSIRTSSKSIRLSVVGNTGDNVHRVWRLVGKTVPRLDNPGN